MSRIQGPMRESGFNAGSPTGWDTIWTKHGAADGVSRENQPETQTGTDVKRASWKKWKLRGFRRVMLNI